MNIKQHLIVMKDVHDLFKTPPIQVANNISYCNWWKTDAYHEWFTRYLEHWFPEKISKKKIRFYSVFGKRKSLEKPFDGIKIFYTGENVEPRERHSCLQEREEKAKGWEVRMKAYQDYGMPFMDLSIGFGYHEEENYARLPFWIIRYITPESDLSGIKECLDNLEAKRAYAVRTSDDRNSIAVIASHDFFGTRAFITDTIANEIPGIRISYAGKWRNNTDELWTTYQNDKIKFLSHFMINICPENMDAPGYVTEKIFDAFQAGTIPVYSGALGQPESNIINPDAFFLWNYEEANSEIADAISDISKKPEEFYEFNSQPVFQHGAADAIYEQYFEPLYGKLKLLF